MHLTHTRTHNEASQRCSLAPGGGRNCEHPPRFRGGGKGPFHALEGGRCSPENRVFRGIFWSPPSDFRYTDKPPPRRKPVIHFKCNFYSLQNLKLRPKLISKKSSCRCNRKPFLRGPKQVLLSPECWTSMLTLYNKGINASIIQNRISNETCQNAPATLSAGTSRYWKRMDGKLVKINKMSIEKKQ